MNEFLFIATFQYVTNVPFFWASMMGIIILFMFIGATIYDGELGKVGKGLLTIIAYSATLSLVINSRLGYMIDKGKLVTLTPEQVYANIMTIGLTTLFCVLGLLFGVLVVCLAQHRVRSGK